MLPLVIRISGYKGVFYPDTAAGQMESGIGKRPPEIHAFRICMEHISCPALFEVICHVLECCQQKAVKFFTLDAVILDGKPVPGFKRYPIRWIRNDDICLFPIH